MTATSRKPDTVPYIAPWGGEVAPDVRLVWSAAGGIAYADERPEDRDDRGVLWKRRESAPQTGRPEFGNVHPARQREMMQNRGCQVCGGPADRDDRGMLWLIEDHRSDWPGWPDDLLTTHPPICLPCAATAVQWCPHLARGYVTVRVAGDEVFGVYGRRYGPAGLTPIRLHNDVARYGSTAAPWMLAGQLVRSLSGCTIVDLRAELDRGR